MAIVPPLANQPQRDDTNDTLVEPVTIDPPTPNGQDNEHVSVAITDRHAGATRITIKAAGSDAREAFSSSAAPAALVRLMQQRLSLPLVALFPAVESELLKLRLAQEEEERARSSPDQDEPDDSQNAQKHNQSVMDKFAETANGQASAKLVEQQRQLDVEAQLALPHVADKAIADRSQLQSTRLYANVPAMMLGEEMQRVGAFSRRDQQTVLDHVQAMALNFQALFSATTTMSTTAQAQCERVPVDPCVWMMTHSSFAACSLRRLLCLP